MIKLPTKKFGRLTPVAIFQQTGWGNNRVLCLCDCGILKDYAYANLYTGTSKSCGCLREERYKHHGLSTVNGECSSEYGTWRAIKTRCFNSNSPSYKHYGGRGITMCDRWRNDYAAFHADMGPRPSPNLSIDRINNDGNYEPGNCRWATQKQQIANRRKPDPEILSRRGKHAIAARWANHIKAVRKVSDSWPK